MTPTHLPFTDSSPCPWVSVSLDLCVSGPLRPYVSTSPVGPPNHPTALRVPPVRLLRLYLPPSPPWTGRCSHQRRDATGSSSKRLRPEPFLPVFGVRHRSTSVSESPRAGSGPVLSEPGLGGLVWSRDVSRWRGSSRRYPGRDVVVFSSFFEGPSIVRRTKHSFSLPGPCPDRPTPVLS